MLDVNFNAMIPGKKILALFAFVQIEKFQAINDIILEVIYIFQDIMTFVNDIADIVHATVETMMGSPNKNIGEAFLLVWKFPDESIHR